VKVRDEDAWRQFEADVAADPSPQAVVLRDFVVSWAHHAETYLAESLVGHEPTPMHALRHVLRVGHEPTPMHALRHVLRLTEASSVTGSRRTIGVIGAALSLLTMHWEFGEQLYDEMTTIEQRLVEDTLVLKLTQLAQQAQEAGNAQS
jgi:hypothetical protein